jgi:hypothetical protein
MHSRRLLRPAQLGKRSACYDSALRKCLVDFREWNGIRETINGIKFSIFRRHSTCSCYLRMQTVPTVVKDLLSLGQHVANGLETYSLWLGMTQTPSSEFRRILDETEKAEAAWSDAENTRVHSQARMAAADEDLTAWLTKARLVVMLARGEKWSERWIETGFAHRATNVPKRIDTRIKLARKVVVFLALHPEYGVSFADVTAVRGRSIYERMIQARAASDLAGGSCTMKKRLLNAAKRVLRSTIYQVIRTLDFTIAPNDPRWLAFGLNQPITSPSRWRHVHHHRFSEAPTEAEPIPLITETHSSPERTIAVA